MAETGRCKQCFRDRHIARRRRHHHRAVREAADAGLYVLGHLALAASEQACVRWPSPARVAGRPPSAAGATRRLGKTGVAGAKGAVAGLLSVVAKVCYNMHASSPSPVLQASSLPASVASPSGPGPGTGGLPSSRRQLLEAFQHCICCQHAYATHDGGAQVRLSDCCLDLPVFLPFLVSQFLVLIAPCLSPGVSNCGFVS